MTLASLALLGLLGTGHCIGMCGPLVFAFPGRTGKPTSHLVYHAGRLLTYAIIGGVMGGLGTGLAALAAGTGGNYLVWVAGIQVGFSMLAGVFLCIFGLIQLGVIREQGWMSIAAPDKIPGYRTLLRTSLSGQRHAEMFLTGLMMGLLPCGLSFAAFSRALAAGGAAQGATMLVAFGAGTLPGLLLVGMGASTFARRYRRHSDILSGMLMIAMAVKLMVDAGQSVL